MVKDTKCDVRYSQHFELPDAPVSIIIKTDLGRSVMPLAKARAYCYSRLQPADRCWRSMLGDRNGKLLWCFFAPLAGALLVSSSQLPLEESSSEAVVEARLQKKYGLSSAACRVAHRCNVTAVDAAARQKELASYPIWSWAEVKAEPHGCSCKNGCELFGACCADMIDRNADSVLRKRMPRNSYSCSDWLGAATGEKCDPLGSGLTVVHRCPVAVSERLKPLSSNASLSAKCAFPMNASSKRTDELATPVTDRETGATYRNIHCATCWNVPQRDLVSWQWKLTCTESPPPNPRPLTTSRQDNQSDSPAMTEQLWLEKFELFLRESCRLVLEPPPGVLKRLHRCQPELEDDCHYGNDPATNRSIVDAEARACARAPTAIVYSRPKSGGRSVAYRNFNCSRCRALVNNVSYGDEDLTCAPTMALGSHWQCFGASGMLPGLSLTVLLSRSGNSDLTDVLCRSFSLQSLRNGALTTDREQCARVALCALDDVATEETPDESTLCSFLCQTPGERYVRTERRCRPASNATSSCRYFSRWPETGSVSAGHLPPAMTAALRARFEIDHNERESGTLVVPINDTLSVCFRCTQRISFVAYELLDDGVLRANGSSYAPPLYVVDVEHGVATVCVPSEKSNVIFGATEASVDGGDCEALPDWVTTVILATSIACLMLYLVLFASWDRLRHFPGDMVANEACAFLVGFTLFLLRPLAADSAIACHVLAVGIHYFLVAAFVWMTLYAIEIVRALSFSGARLTGTTSDSPRRRRIAYYTIGWCLPLAIVGSALMADWLGAHVRPAYGLPQCFLNSLRGNRAFFIAPLCAATLIVVGVYGYMTIRLVIIARQTRAAKRRGADAEKLILAVKLLFALGPLWLLAVLSSFIDSPPIACTFVVLNASQGIFLLIAYVCNSEAHRKALRCWMRLCRRCRYGRLRLQIRSTASASRSDGETVSQSAAQGEGTLTQTSFVNTSN